MLRKISGLCDIGVVSDRMEFMKTNLIIYGDV